MSGARGSKKSIWDTRFGKQKKALAFDECLKVAGWAIDDWITVHPNGPDEVGRHVELDDQGRILHGMGKENEGKKMSEVGIKSAFPKDYHNEPNRPDDINHPGFKKRVWGYNAEIKENERKAAEAAKQAQEKQETQEKKESQENKSEPKVDLKGGADEMQKKIDQLTNKHLREQIDAGERKWVSHLYVEGKTKEAHDAKTQEIKDAMAYALPMQQSYLEQNLEAIEPKNTGTPFSSEFSVDRLANDDRTGACATLALGYAAMRAGYDVETGRGEDSKDMVAGMIDGIIQDAGGVIKKEQGCTMSMLGIKDPVYPRALTVSAINEAHFEEGKEYLVSACGNAKGGHAAIMRINNGKYEYLELQSTKDKGWHEWNNLYTWDQRFGMHRKSLSGVESGAAVISLDDLTKSQAFKNTLPYINKKRQTEA